jgi:RNA polymerase sigma-70 factor, ECF subfamily
VARNAALDHMRARRAVPCEDVRVTDEAGDELGSSHSHSLRTAPEQLPSDQREVLILRHIAGLSPTEIAVRLDKSESSVHGLHHRGRRALCALLEELDARPVTLAAG